MTPRDAASARSILALILSFGLAFTAVGEAKGRTKGAAASKAHSPRSAAGHVRAARASSRPTASRAVHAPHLSTAVGSTGHSRQSFVSRPTPSSRSRATSSPRSSTRKAPATKAAAAPKTTRSRASQHVTAGRTAAGRIKRSPAAKHAFEVQTGYPHGRSGYVVDHIRPLACGGADAPSNMQWQTVAAAKAKDKIERAGCR